MSGYIIQQTVIPYFHTLSRTKYIPLGSSCELQKKIYSSQIIIFLSVCTIAAQPCDLNPHRKNTTTKAKGETQPAERPELKVLWLSLETFPT